MKTTFLFRDGLTQVVLHPETKAERAVLDVVGGAQDRMSVEVHRAQFSESRAGYVRDYGRYPTSPFQDAAHLPDTVLVMRPAESPKTVEVVPPGIDLYRRTDGTWFYRDSAYTWNECPSPLPDDVDLCKRTDGTWVYRNHAGTWQGCPPPFSEDRTVPPPPESAVMDVDLCRFRDGSWARYSPSETPGVGVWATCPPPDQTYEVQQLKAELRTVRDQYVENRGDMSADEALRAISRVVTNALGDRP